MTSQNIGRGKSVLKGVNTLQISHHLVLKFEIKYIYFKRGGSAISIKQSKYSLCRNL
jgi:hypothetical protein